MKDGYLQTSINASLFIQILTLLLNLFSFFVPLDKWDFALKQILGLETFVQIIELLFYTWYRGELLEKVYDVTQFRYYDWFLTTPTMLFSTASYYGYLESIDTKKAQPFDVFTFFQNNATWIWLMFFCNAFMLMFGYLQEVGVMSTGWSTVLGYLALVGSFSVLYRFVAKVPNQQGVYKLMFGTWSLYGVAALLPTKEKNISYNVLDIFAKNFYGLYLSYVIYGRKI
jgi:hypothetical protein